MLLNFKKIVILLLIFLIAFVSTTFVYHPCDATIFLLMSFIATMVGYIILDFQHSGLLRMTAEEREANNRENLILKENFFEGNNKTEEDMTTGRTYINLGPAISSTSNECKGQKYPSSRFCYKREDQTVRCPEGQDTGLWNLDGINQGFIPPGKVTNNQKLINEKGKRQNIPVIIPPKSHDLNYWKATPWTEHSHVNSSKNNFDQVSSGYLYNTNTGYEGDMSTSSRTDCMYPNTYPAQQRTFIEEPAGVLVENYYHNPNYDGKQSAGDGKQYRKRRLGKVDYCALDAKTKKPIIQSCNHRLDRLGKNPPPDRYRTSIVQPPMDDGVKSGGIYSSSDIIEPVSLGYQIGSPTMFGARTKILDEDNHLVYHEHRPEMDENDLQYLNPNECPDGRLKVAEAFDPRHYGYGSENRGRVDSYARSSSIKYDYDDINRLKQPMNPARTEIDHLSHMQSAQDHGIGSYGYLPDNPTQLRNHNNLHQYVDAAYHNSQLDFRADLTESRMRKAYDREWQRRASPITTFRR